MLKRMPIKRHRAAIGRIENIADAALRTFIRRGFKLTQIADIAREAGVSTSTLYLYAEGKEALLALALCRAAGRMPREMSAPIRTAEVGEIVTAVGDEMARRIRWPRLEAALLQTADDGGIASEFPDIVKELYETMARERHLIWLLGSCADELSELDAAYNSRLRKSYIKDFTAYVRARADAGHLRSDLNPIAAARATMEMAVWMAMSRHRDPLPPSLDEGTARSTVVAMAIAALQQDGAKGYARQADEGGICGKPED